MLVNEGVAGEFEEDDGALPHQQLLHVLSQIAHELDAWVTPAEEMRGRVEEARRSLLGGHVRDGEGEVAGSSERREGNGLLQELSKSTKHLNYK